MKKRNSGCCVVQKKINKQNNKNESDNVKATNQPEECLAGINSGGSNHHKLSYYPPQHNGSRVKICAQLQLVLLKDQQ